MALREQNWLDEKGWWLRLWCDGGGWWWWTQSDRPLEHREESGLGRKQWTRNCGIPAKKLVTLKDWEGRPQPRCSFVHTHLISEEHWECRAVKVQVINAVLKKHMKIVREAIFHAPVKGNNLRTCCTPEIPNSENSLARFLAFLCALRKLMIPCEILSWLEIVYLTFTSSSKFLRLTNFHQSIELKMTFVSIYFKSSWSDWSSFMTLIFQRKLLS